MLICFFVFIFIFIATMSSFIEALIVYLVTIVLTAFIFLAMYLIGNK